MQGYEKSWKKQKEWGWEPVKVDLDKLKVDRGEVKKLV